MRWVLFWGAAMLGVAQVKSVPLFTIEKSSNANRVQYDARVTADGRRQELNVLERAKAYGFTIRQEGLDSYKLWVVSHREKEIHVFRDGGTVRAEAGIGGRVARVEKIFIQMHKSFLLSFPDFGEMFGFDRETGEKRY